MTAITLNTVEDALDFFREMDGAGIVITDEELLEETLADECDLPRRIAEAA